MKDPIKLIVIDRVTGICPPCKHAAITVDRDRGVYDGYANLKEQSFTLYCKHEAICNLRSSDGEEEIVRCKNCIWFDDMHQDPAVCYAPGMGQHEANHNGYCAWGERKAVEE